MSLIFRKNRGLRIIRAAPYLRRSGWVSSGIHEGGLDIILPFWPAHRHLGLQFRDLRTDGDAAAAAGQEGNVTKNVFFLCMVTADFGLFYRAIARHLYIHAFFQIGSQFVPLSSCTMEAIQNQRKLCRTLPDP